MHQRIRKKLAEKGLSEEGVSVAIGRDRSYLRKLFEKSTTTPRIDTIEALADQLGVSSRWILKGDESFETSDEPKLSFRHGDDSDPIPVMGVAAGSLLKGAAQLIDGPIDYIPRPRTLQYAQGIYALYMDGTSMEPMFKHGQPVLVSKYKPARLEDAVAVQEQHSVNAPILASVGILESRSEKQIVLRKLNPDGRLEIKQQFVTSIHKVLDYQDLMGYA